MTKDEELLLEAVKGLLSGPMLGIKELHGDPAEREHSHFLQFRRESMDDAFRLKVADSTQFESVTSAFYAVHCVKYIDDPTFPKSFLAEMKSRAVPLKEQQKALKALQEIIKETLKETGDERSLGWNTQLDEIIEIVQDLERSAKKTEPFTGGTT